MKIIEAMKKVKLNDSKVIDLQNKIAGQSASLSHETPLYSDTKEQVRQWLQACEDITQENIKLLVAIQRTNLVTNVTISLSDKNVTKTIAEWVWRRRNYAAMDLATYGKLTDRNLREGQIQTSTGSVVEVKIVRNFDPVERDNKLSIYRQEPSEIDSALEVVNAVTDLILD